MKRELNMRLFTLLAAVLVCTIGFAQNQPTKEERTRGLKKISSSQSYENSEDIAMDFSGLSGLSALESLEGLQALQSLQSLEGLEVLEDLELDLGNLESLEVMSSMDLSGLHSMKVIMEMNQEIMKSIDIEAIVDMSIDISIEALESIQDIDIDLDQPRNRTIQQ